MMLPFVQEISEYGFSVHLEVTQDPGSEPEMLCATLRVTHTLTSPLSTSLTPKVWEMQSPIFMVANGLESLQRICWASLGDFERACPAQALNHDWRRARGVMLEEVVTKYQRDALKL